jgi:hypothetical protein
VAGSGRAEEGSKQAEVEKQTGGQKHAGREERGCGQGRRDKQAGKQVDSSHAKVQKQKDAQLGRCSYTGMQRSKQADRYWEVVRGGRQTQVDSGMQRLRKQGEAE